MMLLSSRSQASCICPRRTARRLQRSQKLLVSANLFANLFGGGKKKESEPANYVSDEDLPFPRTLLSSTYLKGKPELACLLSFCKHTNVKLTRRNS